MRASILRGLGVVVESIGNGGLHGNETMAWGKTKGAGVGLASSFSLFLTILGGRMDHHGWRFFCFYLQFSPFLFEVMGEGCVYFRGDA